MSLPERQMVVTGTFDNARALSASTVLGRTSPVAEQHCGRAKANLGASISDVTIERGVTRTSGGDEVQLLASFSATSGTRAQPNATKTYDDPLDGAGALSVASERPGGEVEVKLISRQLSRRSPPMFAADVLAVQMALSDAGWPVLQDGYYGRYTEAAIVAFQRAHKLTTDGVLGPDTLRALGL